jgi:hypothetical protein
MALGIDGIGQAREPDGSLLSQPRRDFRVDRGTAQLRDERRQREWPSRPTR